MGNLIGVNRIHAQFVKLSENMAFSAGDAAR